LLKGRSRPVPDGRGREKPGEGERAARGASGRQSLLFAAEGKRADVVADATVRLRWTAQLLEAEEVRERVK
jgi:hypothetical protein